MSQRVVRRGALALFSFLAAVGTSSALPAQDLETQGREVDAEVIAAMHERAEALHAQKQFGRSNQLWQELVQEWAPGDEKALERLGFVQVGTVWRRDMNKVVFDRDLQGDKKELKKLDRDWERTVKSLGKSVGKLAKALSDAGREELAQVYWRRLLLLVPGDKQALKQMQLPTFDGHAGSLDDLHLLRRGRAFAQAVEFLKEYEPPVEQIDEPNELLAKTGVMNAGVRSRHFRVWGNLPLDKLMLGARYAERGLLLSRLMFDCAGGAVFRPQRVLDFMWMADKASYQQVLDGCADQFPPDRLRFLKEDVELAFVAVGDEPQRLYALTTGGDDVIMDVSARGAVQDAANLVTHGLWEGLGHATCAILFDRTLSFFVEQQRGDTVTSWVPRPLLPEMETWRQIATESAWAKNDTPMARLVLLEGHRFTNEERVKSWAMVEYLLRSRPELLLQLEESKTKDTRDEGAVAAEFMRRTGIQTAYLDDQWRQYWGKGKQLRDAMAAQPAGTKEEVQGARDLAWTIVRARVAADVAPAGYLVAAGKDTAAAHAWIAQLIKHEKEVQKDPKKADLQPPPPPSVVGSTVLVHRSTDPVATVDHWLGQPAVRDYLLDPGRLFFGCHRGDNAFVLDLLQPASPVTHGRPDAWPLDGQTGIAADVAVGDLGPGMQEPFVERGFGLADRVGMPVTLHFHRELTDGERAAIRCSLRAGGLERQGGMVFCGQLDGLSAPGCVAFVPIEPLPAGAEIRVEWTLPAGVLGKDEVFPDVTFTTR